MNSPLNLKPQILFTSGNLPLLRGMNAARFSETEQAQLTFDVATLQL